MRLMMPCLLAVVLSGCGEAQAPTPRDLQTGQAEGLPATPDPPQPPARPDGEITPAPGGAPTLLQPIVRAEWERRIAPGSRCNLSIEGRDYVIAAPGDGAARVGGAVVDLTGAPGEFDALTRGGRFTGGGATIEIVLAPDLGEGESVEEEFTKPVRVAVRSGGADERFTAAWTCGV